MRSLILCESNRCQSVFWLRRLNNSGVFNTWGVFQGAGFLGLAVWPLKQIVEN